MKINQFPFPSKTVAREELLRDLSVNKISKDDVDKIIDLAWNHGIKASHAIMEKFDENLDFKKIAEVYGIDLVNQDIDYVVGNVRFFSEYYTRKNAIIMYMRSIDQWAEANDLEFSEAYNLILAHEFFHYLEVNEIGLTSKLHQRPLFQIGSLKLGKTGVKAMSEIGAHAFVYELFKKEYKQ